MVKVIAIVGSEPALLRASELLKSAYGSAAVMPAGVFALCTPVPDACIWVVRSIEDMKKAVNTASVVIHVSEFWYLQVGHIKALTEDRDGVELPHWQQPLLDAVSLAVEGQQHAC